MAKLLSSRTGHEGANSAQRTSNSILTSKSANAKQATWPRAKIVFRLASSAARITCIRMGRASTSPKRRTSATRIKIKCFPLSRFDAFAKNSTVRKWTSQGTLSAIRTARLTQLSTKRPNSAYAPLVATLRMETALSAKDLASGMLLKMPACVLIALSVGKESACHARQVPRSTEPRMNACVSPELQGQGCFVGSP